MEIFIIFQLKNNENLNGQTQPLQARFKRRVTALPNSIDRIKFDFSTAVARRLKPRQASPCYTAVARLGFKRRATAVPNSIHKLQMHQNTFKSLLNCFFITMFCFRQQLFYSTELNSTSETKACQCRAAVELKSRQLSMAVARRLKQVLGD